MKTFPRNPNGFVFKTRTTNKSDRTVVARGLKLVVWNNGPIYFCQKSVVWELMYKLNVAKDTTISQKN